MTPGLVGRRRLRRDRPHRRSLRVGGRDQRSQRHPGQRRRRDDRRRALHLPSRDLTVEAAGRRRRPRSAAAGRSTKSAATPTSSIRRPDKLLKAGSRIVFPNVHMHANGKDTTGHLEVGFKFHPKGYKPKVNERTMPDRHRRHRHPRRWKPGKKLEAFHDALAAHEDHRLRTAHARAGGAHVPRRDLGIAHRDAELLGLRPQLGARLPVRRRLRRRCCRTARSSTSSATSTTRRRTRTSPIRGTGQGSGTARSTT